MKLLSLLFASMRLASSVDRDRVSICSDIEHRDALIEELCGDDKPAQVAGVENRNDQPPLHFGQVPKLY